MKNDLRATIDTVFVSTGFLYASVSAKELDTLENKDDPDKLKQMLDRGLPLLITQKPEDLPCGVTERAEMKDGVLSFVIRIPTGLDLNKGAYRSTDGLLKVFDSGAMDSVLINWNNYNTGVVAAWVSCVSPGWGGFQFDE